MEDNTQCAIVDFSDDVRQAIFEISPNLELSKVTLKKGKRLEQVPALETAIGEANRIYRFALDQGKQFDFKVALSADTQTGHFKIVPATRWKKGLRHRKSLQQTVTEQVQRITGSTPRRLVRGRLGTAN